ncbi:MAG TPA: SdrD B-like domain-containing protein [Candidatus Krumholzibacteria bacterium]|nr:SdrD B-like domain-containing protein [Candidatus Krumholzibacteria bacterium]
MRPFFSRLLVVACMLAAAGGCSNDATSPDANSSNESSVRENTGDTQQPPIDGGSITGLIFNDADLDGLLDFGERGVSEVLVTLRRVGTGGGPALGAQRATRTDFAGRYTFERLAAGTYEVSALPSTRISSTPDPLEVVLTETNGQVSDVFNADLAVVANNVDDGQNGDSDRLAVGAFIRVSGDYLPDSNVLLARGWSVDDCESDECIFGMLVGPITFIDDRTKSFAVMGTLMRAGEDTFPLYAQVGHIAHVILHHAGVGDDFIADRVSPVISNAELIEGRIDELRIVGDTARLVVLNTVVVIHDL